MDQFLQSWEELEFNTLEIDIYIAIQFPKLHSNDNNLTQHLVYILH